MFPVEDINQIVAKNLADLRKTRNLTQGELAEKFSYSDKAISKWEHGETMPDLATLQQLADFYGVTLDYLTHVPTEDNKKLYTKEAKPTMARRHWFAIVVSLVFVFFVATVICAGSVITNNPDKDLVWIPFLWAAAVSCLIVAIFFTRWRMKKEAVGFWIASDWTVLTAIYISMGIYMKPENTGWSLWVIYIVGLPLMVGFLLALRWEKLD